MTPQPNLIDVNQNENLAKLLHAFTTLFSRPYLNIPMLPNEPERVIEYVKTHFTAWVCLSMSDKIILGMRARIMLNIQTYIEINVLKQLPVPVPTVKTRRKSRESTLVRCL